MSNMIETISETVAEDSKVAKLKDGIFNDQGEDGEVKESDLDDLINAAVDATLRALKDMIDEDLRWIERQKGGTR